MRDEKEFIRTLARFLCEDEAMKSILLEITRSRANLNNPAMIHYGKIMEQWADLRSSAPLSGYTSVDEAEEILTNWLDNNG